MTARQCIATLCLVALLPSCTTFKTYDGVPPGTEGKVRVTLDRGGAPILLHDAQQMGDQYVGGLDGRTWFIGCEDCSIRSIPIDSIARFEINEVNAGGDGLGRHPRHRGARGRALRRFRLQLRVSVGGGS